MRLTNEMRESVVVKAIAARFKEREAALVAARTAAADALYEHLFGKHEAQALAMPAGWIEKAVEITISMEGFASRYFVDNRGDRRPSCTFSLSRERVWPCNALAANGGDPGTFKIEPGHKLFKMFEAVRIEHQAIADAKADLRAKLRALLFSCTTSDALRKAWPDGAEFFPAEVKRETALVPVHLVPEINKIMGLPPKTRRKVAA